MPLTLHSSCDAPARSVAISRLGRKNRLIPAAGSRSWRPRAMSESNDPPMECFGYFRPCEIASHSLLQIVSSQPHHVPYV